jgi:hypothetical protein
MSSGRVAALVMKIQTDFLDTPDLTLTLSQAQQRFGVNAIQCEAVLNVLVDANVLKARDGSYRRFFPRLTPRADAANPRRCQSDARQPVAGVAA